MWWIQRRILLVKVSFLLFLYLISLSAVAQGIIATVDEVQEDAIPSLDLRRLDITQTIFNSTKSVLLFLYDDDGEKDAPSPSFKFTSMHEYFISLLHPLQARWSKVLNFYMCPKSTCAPAVLAVFYLKLSNLPRAVIHDVRKDLKFVQPPSGHIPMIGAGNAHISTKTLEEFIFNTICGQEDSSRDYEDTDKEWIEVQSSICKSLPVLKLSDEVNDLDEIDFQKRNDGSNNDGYYSKEKIRSSRKRLKIDMYGNYINENEDLNGNSDEIGRHDPRDAQNVEMISNAPNANTDEDTPDSADRNVEVTDLASDFFTSSANGDKGFEIHNVDTREMTGQEKEEEEEEEQQLDEYGRIMLSNKELELMLQRVML